MKKYILSLLAFLFLPLTASAVTLSLEDQILEQDKRFILNMLPNTGTTPFQYDFYSTNIPASEWFIDENYFYWTPKNTGLYNGVFTIYDAKGDIAKESILFSVVSDIPQQRILSESKSNTSLKDEVSRNTNKLRYLRKTDPILREIYQPVSLYYTRGVVPYTFSIIQDKQDIALRCIKGGQAIEKTFFPYSGEIPAPLWITKRSAEDVYRVPQVETATDYIYIKLPDDVKISGCQLLLDKNFSSYRIFSLQTKTLGRVYNFTQGKGIPIKAGAIVVLNPSTIKKMPERKISKRSHKDPYIHSLLQSSVPRSLTANKKAKQSLTRAEMAAIVIHAISPAASRVAEEKRKERAYWGFKDVLKSPYQGEIYLFKKYHYDSGIRDDFFPEKIATMEDLYFALARPLGISVNWWQTETLLKEMKKLGLVTSSQDMKDSLTLEKAAKVIFLVHETLTKRGGQVIDENDPRVILARNENLFTDKEFEEIKRSSLISRSDFLKIFSRKIYTDFSVMSLYKDDILSNQQKLPFDDLNKNESTAAYAYFAFKKNIMPREWLTSKKFYEDKAITRSEALEIFLRSKQLFDDAEVYYQDTIRSCFKNTVYSQKSSCVNQSNFLDLQFDFSQAQNFSYAFYAEKYGIMSGYTDRYGEVLNLFSGDGRLALLEMLHLVYWR